MASRKRSVREYCHCCKMYSDWQYEDRDGNQIIECPVCGHMHYRIVSGKVIEFELQFRDEKIRNMNRIREVIEQHPETKKELEYLWAVLEYGDLEMALELTMTNERWGQDSRQNNSSWGISLNTTSSMQAVWYVSASTTSTGNMITYWNQ